MTTPRPARRALLLPRRIVRFAAGAAILFALIPSSLDLAGAVWRATVEGAGLDAVGALAAPLVPLVALVAYGLSLVAHALRGTEGRGPLLPLAVAIPCLLAIGVHRAGGLAPVIAGAQGTPMTLVVSVATVGIALAVHVVVHEGGHLAAARLVGSRFQSVRLGPFVVMRRGSGLRIERNRFRPAGVLGFALSVPESDERFAWKFGVTVAGGPAATAALTAALWGSAWALSPPVGEAAQVAAFALWHGAFVGLFLTAANLVPLRFRSSVRTDGAFLRLALGARTRAAQAFLRYVLHAAQGRRPRDWGTTAEALLAAADADPRHPPEIPLAALAVALDRGEWARAESILARVAVRPEGDAVRQEFTLQAALLSALVLGEPLVARARLASLGPMPVPDYPLLTEAAIACAEGDAGEARALLARWRDSMDRAGIPALRVGNEWAEELLEERLSAAARRAPEPQPAARAEAAPRRGP